MIDGKITKLENWIHKEAGYATQVYQSGPSLPKIAEATK